MACIPIADDHRPMLYFFLETTNIGPLDLVPDASVFCVGRFLPILAIRAMTCVHPGNSRPIGRHF
jgi:hypothetical protein